MKNFFRSAAVQGFLSMILAFYLWLILRTIRWTWINIEPSKEVLARPGGVIPAASGQGGGDYGQDGNSDSGLGVLKTGMHGGLPKSFLIC